MQRRKCVPRDKVAKFTSRHAYFRTLPSNGKIMSKTYDLGKDCKPTRVLNQILVRFDVKLIKLFLGPSIIAHADCTAKSTARWRKGGIAISAKYFFEMTEEMGYSQYDAEKPQVTS